MASESALPQQQKISGLIALIYPVTAAIKKTGLPLCLIMATPIITSCLPAMSLLIAQNVYRNSDNRCTDRDIRLYNAALYQ